MEEIEHLHTVLLILMDEIDRVCRMNKIEYTITGGSMLGAVRHNGFIPWDDDMDIALTRKNYEKLLENKDKFGENFFLQTYDTDSNYYYGYAKLLLNNTVTVEYGHENTKYKKGIFIDIFPLDNVPSENKIRNKQEKINYFIQKLLRKKMNISDNNNWGINQKILSKLLSFIGLFVDGNRLVHKLNFNMRIAENENSTYITNLCGMYGYQKEMAQADWFLNYEEIKFENKKYMVIKEHDKYLTKLYGNYMELPPLEKRHTHEFGKIDFGKY